MKKWNARLKPNPNTTVGELAGELEVYIKTAFNCLKEFFGTLYNRPYFFTRLNTRCF